ncbi:chorismate synthase [Bartonella sp. TP]|uniref:chorismate synthase n=1 Tax=Bartonella sp. TP TaxID=3057550 RepID=UPI0025B056CE|nr:chorismate synthase [Bartonella sp. TP]MDN5248806.1 chorismate synthase [Alphaproteobacteria bacterium]WJW80196.1 chorismate synthase [Bartonella sp. TP]
MSHNSFGHLFRVTTWGESHGAAIGCVVDGCPPHIIFSQGEMQHYMNKRRPGQSAYVSSRQEADNVEILSGVIEQETIDGTKTYLTTGTPISLLIRNIDSRSKDYDELADIYRPSHGDYSYDAKYEVRDHRGGGRASARETATRVAAGVIARKILPMVKIRGAITSIGPYSINYNNWNWEEVARNSCYCPDQEASTKFADYLKQIKEDGSSVGGVVTIIAENVPKGLGAPIYGKLDQDLAGLIMSINAVKAVEIGAGFSAAMLRGEEHADQMTIGSEGAEFLSNNAGGILAGISTGQPIVISFAVKPTSSIAKNLQTINKAGEAVQLTTKGRHDPCIAIRAVAVGEAMVACALADHFLRHRGQIGVANLS